jgi:hypothetical protein
MKNNSNNSIKISVLIVFIVLIIGGYYIFINKYNVESFLTDRLLIDGKLQAFKQLNSLSLNPIKLKEGDVCWQTFGISNKPSTIPFTAATVKIDSRGYAHCNKPNDKVDNRFYSAK